MAILLLNADTPDEAAEPARIGSKAANLVRLARAGLRVPAAFVLDVTCTRMADGGLTTGVRREVREGIAYLERVTGRQFGGARIPLLVSVRSSPPVSMPGMLDTMLNVGLTSAARHGLLRTTGNPYLVWDVARRFVQSYAELVAGSPAAAFARAQERALSAAGVTAIDELDPLALRALADELGTVGAASGARPPDDAFEQVECAIEAVFRSWSARRAVDYRRMNGLDDAAGTAVIVQTMVLGNDRAASGSGVGFTRNPSTGADELYIDFLANAQGEDVVSGRRRVSASAQGTGMLPEIAEELSRARRVLEQEFGEMQDFEFTVEDGVLYFLQSRCGKRTPWAALHIAIDLVRAGIVSPEEARMRLDTYDLPSICRVRLAPGPDVTPIAAGVPAGLGVVSGAIAFDSRRAQQMAVTQPVILVREDLSTDDVSGLAASAGLLTANGGRTSHAAVVARQLGKVSVVGCSSLRIEDARRRCAIGSSVFVEGDLITLDGDSGCVYAGSIPVAIERPETALSEIREWAMTATAVTK